MYNNLKKFAEKKGIVATKFTEKKAYAESKKGKTLTTAERNALVDQMLKDLGYLTN